MSRNEERRANHRFEGSLEGVVFFENRDNQQVGSAKCIAEDVSFTGFKLTMARPPATDITAVENREWLLRARFERHGVEIVVQGWARWVDHHSKAFTVGVQYNDERPEHLRLVEWAHVDSNRSLTRQVRGLGVALAVMVLLAIAYLMTRRSSETMVATVPPITASSAPTVTHTTRHETEPFNLQQLREGKPKPAVGEVARELIELAPEPLAKPPVPADAFRFTTSPPPAPPGLRPSDELFRWTAPRVDGQRVSGEITYTGPSGTLLRVALRDAVGDDVEGCYVNVPLQPQQSSYRIECNSKYPVETPVFAYYLLEP